MHSSDLPGEPEPAATDGAGTSSGRVAGALEALTTLDETPLSGHPDIYQGIHAELQGALADIDDA